MLPEVRYGTTKPKLVLDDEPDDDEPVETQQDVIDMLGFDPKVELG